MEITDILKGKVKITKQDVDDILTHQPSKIKEIKHKHKKNDKKQKNIA